MGTARLSCHLPLTAAAIALLSFAAPAFGDAKTDLAKELTGLVFPRDKLIQLIAHQLPEGNRATALDAMQRQFDYTRVERQVAPIYTAAFSEDELRQIVAFQKSPTGRALQAATERGPTAEQLPMRPESPPADTHASRLVQAEQLAAIMMTKELVLDTLRQLLADEPAAQRREALAEVEQVFDDPAQLRRLRLIKARELAQALTTDELEEAATFYSTPAGRRLLEHNVRVGRAAMEAAMQEMVRVSGTLVEEAQRELRRVIESQRSR